jgi:hypothetical protein
MKKEEFTKLVYNFVGNTANDILEEEKQGIEEGRKAHEEKIIEEAKWAFPDLTIVEAYDLSLHCILRQYESQVDYIKTLINNKDK